MENLNLKVGDIGRVHYRVSFSKHSAKQASQFAKCTQVGVITNVPNLEEIGTKEFPPSRLVNFLSSTGEFFWMDIDDIEDFTPVRLDPKVREWMSTIGKMYANMAKLKKQFADIQDKLHAQQADIDSGIRNMLDAQSDSTGFVSHRELRDTINQDLNDSLRNTFLMVGCYSFAHDTVEFDILHDSASEILCAYNEKYINDTSYAEKMAPATIPSLVKIAKSVKKKTRIKDEEIFSETIYHFSFPKGLPKSIFNDIVKAIKEY